MSVRTMIRVGAGLCVLGACGVMMALAQPGAEKKTDSSASSTSSGMLKVGDSAPAIKIDSWVKGEPVESFASGKVYVVEFWATWCGPCVRSIPHMTELQKKFEDKVIVIGVASSERKGKDGSDNRLDNLKKFVDSKAETMAYRVAYDSDRDMGDAWLKAAGKTTIPTAFIVDQHGKVAWIGHPNKLESELQRVVDSGAMKGADATDRHDR